MQPDQAQTEGRIESRRNVDVFTPSKESAAELAVRRVDWNRIRSKLEKCKSTDKTEKYSIARGVCFGIAGTCLVSAAPILLAIYRSRGTTPPTEVSFETLVTFFAYVAGLFAFGGIGIVLHLTDKDRVEKTILDATELLAEMDVIETAFDYSGPPNPTTPQPPPTEQPAAGRATQA